MSDMGDTKVGIDAIGNADADTALPAAKQSPRIDMPSLAADIDDSVDLEAVPGKPASHLDGMLPAGELPSAPMGFVTPGFGSVRTIGIAAGIVAVLAVLMSVFTGLASAWPWILVQTAFHILLHTATGVLSLMIAAQLSERPFGGLTLAFVRMGLAVASLTFFASLNLGLTSTKFEEVTLGIAAYLSVTMLLFRRPLIELSFVWASHSVLWVLLFVASWIDAAAALELAGAK